MNKQPFYGVNLGGWLLLEKWMTPSLFEGTDAVDEYTFMKTPGAADKIERHRKEFITEADIKWLAKNRIDAVRIPVGYWLFEADGPYTPKITYLDWAVQACKKYGIAVLVDLHGAPGSQNGRDHSGNIGKALWYRNKEYREKTISVLEQIAVHYKDEPTVWGIELLNEPKLGLLNLTLRRFYKDAYKRIIVAGRPGLVVVFHDAFTPRLLSGALHQIAHFPVMMDIHWYHFTDWLFKWRPIENYFAKLRRKNALIKRLQRQQPVVIGEWSVVIAHEALKKYGDQDEQALTRRHAALQLEAYSAAAGWFYWTYKTENPGVWHFRSLIEDGTIVLPKI